MTVTCRPTLSVKMIGTLIFEAPTLAVVRIWGSGRVVRLTGAARATVSGRER